MEKYLFKSLYDKDISDKMKEIASLKRNLRFCETPKIEYSNLEEWVTKKKEAYMEKQIEFKTYVIVKYDCKSTYIA